jgi:hypothetical protein
VLYTVLSGYETILGITAESAQHYFETIKHQHLFCWVLLQATPQYRRQELRNSRIIKGTYCKRRKALTHRFRFMATIVAVNGQGGESR